MVLVKKKEKKHLSLNFRTIYHLLKKVSNVLKFHGEEMPNSTFDFRTIVSYGLHI